jgi:hypothetical protein
VGLRDEALEALERVALHADRFERELRFGLVQEAQHRALAVGARQRGNAHVDRARADAQGDAPVLRQPLFGDVEVGHDLQARDQRGMQRTIGLHHFAQRAVDAKAHGRGALVGLDVDVARAVARGLREQRVEHADDGRVARAFQQVFDRRQLLHHARQVGVALHLADHRGGARFALRVGRADALRERAVGQHFEGLHAILARDFGDRTARGMARHPQRAAAVVGFFEQQLLAACERVGQGVAHGRDRRCVRVR